MNIDSFVLAHARFALREMIRVSLSDPNVSLIGIGFPEHGGQIAEDELAIRVHVREKLAPIELKAATRAGYTQPIPRQVVGFKTDVVQGSYKLHPAQPMAGWWQPRDARAVALNPLQGGVSISDAYHVDYGTLGGKVYDCITGDEMILSNWHVLAVDFNSHPGVPIYQPGRLDGGRFANMFARLTRDAMSVNLDAAVATLTGSRHLLNEQFGLGPVAGVGAWQLGMAVVKSGRGSHITHGHIVEFEGMTQMQYGRQGRTIRDVMVIEPVNGGEVSEPGDSGSWWLNEETKEVIGLHFAGSNLPERALALNMHSVLDALGVEIRPGD